jgi:hypothetical protein
MKPTFVILVSGLVYVSLYFSILLLNSLDFNSKVRFDYELKFNCTSDLWSQFSNYKYPLSDRLNRNELKTSLVSTSNTFGDFELEMSHTSYKSEAENPIRMGEGTFKMSGENNQEIFGTYEGFADNKDVILFLSIDGGTGDYEDLNGYLSVRCIPDEIHPNKKVLTMKGTITRISNNTSPLLVHL